MRIAAIYWVAHTHWNGSCGKQKKRNQKITSVNKNVEELKSWCCWQGCEVMQQLWRTVRWFPTNQKQICYMVHPANWLPESVCSAFATGVNERPCCPRSAPLSGALRGLDFIIPQVRSLSSLPFSPAVPQRHRTWSIFPCAYLPSVCFLRRGICSGLLPIFNRFVLFSYWWVLRVLFLYWMTVLYQMCLLPSVFFQFVACLLLFRCFCFCFFFCNQI